MGTSRDASFTLREDGTINTTLWHDFSERSMHEMAVKTKAIVRAHYGRRHAYAYWDGFSTGGRQGYKIAQRYPRDYDGILAGAPAFNWTRFITAELYPQIAMLRELGGPIAPAKLDAVSAAANAVCGGATLGFQIDPFDCRYDPSHDAAALCAGAAGRGVVGGNADAARCVTLAEADVINKIWYGQTTDGSHSDPMIDNAGGPRRGSSRHLWFGLTRGTTLLSLAGTPPFPIASAQVALSLQDPRYAQSDRPYLVNATGSGEDRWRELDYAGLAHAYQRGLELQPWFSYINTDDPDLRGAWHADTKVLSYHGLADELIMPQGSANYFVRAAREMGGIERLQRFNRLFMIPGLAHDSTFSRSGSIDPATGAAASPDKVPLPQPATGRDELFTALRRWVEQGVAPERIDVSSRNGSVTMPLCLYPQKANVHRHLADHRQFDAFEPGNAVVAQAARPAVGVAHRDGGDARPLRCAPVEAVAHRRAGGNIAQLHHLALKPDDRPHRVGGAGHGRQAVQRRARPRQVEVVVRAEEDAGGVGEARRRRRQQPPRGDENKWQRSPGLPRTSAAAERLSTTAWCSSADRPPTIAVRIFAVRPCRPWRRSRNSSPRRAPTLRQS